MPADLPCPTKPVLERFLLGEVDHLSATDLDNLSRHVEQCAHCVALLDSLRGHDSLVAVLRDPAMAVVEPRDEKVEGLIQQLCRPEELATTLSGKGSPADHSPSETPAEDAEDVCRLLAPPERPDEIGRLGPYRVRRVLGVGGMGVVLLAFDPQLQRQVALKTLKPALAASAGARRRFLREAQAIAQVTHDHIVTILHVGEERGVPFLVMPYLPGETLDARLKREPMLAAEEVLRLGQQIVAGLAAAHAKGLIHRDIKPSNVWLEAKQGDRETGRQGEGETKEGANYLSPCLLVLTSA